MSDIAPNNEQEKILVGKMWMLKLDYNLEYHSPKQILQSYKEKKFSSLGWMNAFISVHKVNTFRTTSMTEKLFKGPLQWRMADNMEQYRRDLVSFLQAEEIEKLKLSEDKSQAA